MFIALAICSQGCKKLSNADKLKKSMKPLAKEYLKTNGITDYDSLKIDFVDTVTEMGYANLNSELLEQMEYAYQEQYNEAIANNDLKKADPIQLYINEINRTKADFDELMQSGELKSDGILLFMVTATYFKDGKGEPTIFMVTPDKKALYTLDPFGDNLLYQDEK